MKTIYLPRLFLILFFGLTLFEGCQKAKEKELVLAQVGTATLTLADLRESFPIEFEQVIRRQQYLDFIKRWIDDEVIYQHAQKVGFAKDSVVIRKLAKLSRKLMIEEFLARENGNELYEPDEMTMSQYYEMHKEDFRRNAPEFKIAHLRVHSAKQAAELRIKSNRLDFLELAAANSLDPAPESYASIGFKKLDAFPACLAQVIPNTAINAVTSPIECPDGAYLVKLLERQESGTYIPYADTKEEIRSLLVMGRKDKITEARIAKFKEGLNIGFNLDQIPGQIEAPKTTVANKDTIAPPPAPEPPAVKTALPTKSVVAPVPAEPVVKKRPRSIVPKPKSSPAPVDSNRTEPGLKTPVPDLGSDSPPSNPAMDKPEAEEKTDAK